MAYLAGRDVLCNEAQERHHSKAACVAAQGLAAELALTESQSQMALVQGKNSSVKKLKV